MLLHAILEVCIVHCLAADAWVVLQEFFTASILPRPNSTYICPLSHPAHKTFLTTLKDTCTGRSSRTQTHPPSSTTARSSLTSSLTLCLTHAQSNIMHGLAVVRPARDLAQKDFAGCFVMRTSATDVLEAHLRMLSMDLLVDEFCFRGSAPSQSHIRYTHKPSCPPSRRRRIGPRCMCTSF